MAADPRMLRQPEENMPKAPNALRAAALVAALILTVGTASAAPSGDKMQTATGNVSKVQAAERSVVVALADGPETVFIWTKDTRINGTLAVGAKVTIRYTSLPDGKNVAHQISVSKG